MRAGEGDEIASDAVRLSASMLALAPLLKTAPLQAIARLHAVVGAAALAPDELGRPRDAASADRLRGVAELLLSGSEAPALLMAAVAHADVATAAPFASHNGIVARALERLVLVSRGVDTKSLVVPEAGHLAHRAAYESNLRAYAAVGRAGSRPGRSTGPRPSARGPRPRRCGDSRHQHVRAAPAHVDRVPPLTRDAWLPSVHCLIAASGRSRSASTPSDGWIAAWVPGSRAAV